MSEPLDLFVRISRVMQALDGWCPESKGHTLAAAVIALRPEVSVEIGVWGGKSLIPMAMAHKHIGKGYVIGIDPWHPVESVKGQQNADDVKYWGNINHEEVYGRFMQAVYANDLERIIRVERKPSDAVEPPARIDIASLDGNHGETVIRDAERFGMRVRTGGLIFMDDLDWTGGFVRKAYNNLINAGFIRLYDLGTGCVLQRT